MTWKYGLIRTTEKLPDGNIYYDYTIREIYFNEENSPMSWSAEPARIVEGNPKDIIRVLTRIINDIAFSPSYEVVNGKLIEI